MCANITPPLLVIDDRDKHILVATEFNERTWQLVMESDDSHRDSNRVSMETINGGVSRDTCASNNRS